MCNHVHEVVAQTQSWTSFNHALLLYTLHILRPTQILPLECSHEALKYNTLGEHAPPPRGCASCNLSKHSSILPTRSMPCVLPIIALASKNQCCQRSCMCTIGREPGNRAKIQVPTPVVELLSSGLDGFGLRMSRLHHLLCLIVNVLHTTTSGS